MGLRWVVIFGVLFATPLAAEGVSLLQSPRMGARAVPLLAAANPASSTPAGSLFVGAASGGMFAPSPVRLRAFPKLEEETTAPLAQPPLTGDVDIIRAIIGKAEAGRAGYDAVQHGARIKTPKPPTQMTLAQIFQWIKETPGQPHAIGKYQFIPKTLASVVKRSGIPRSARFSPAVQDALADVLLADAGFARFQNGTLSRKAFMNNLAKIWAGLPNSSGRSHYHGYAGNKAVISWSQFEAAMAQIRPKG